MSSGDYLGREEELYMEPKLKSTIECVLITFDELVRLRQENEQLRKALTKCSPYYYSCGFDDTCNVECRFCGSVDNNWHKPDCEYVRLIGGGEG